MTPAPSRSATNSQETALYSQGGFAVPSPEELARRLPGLEVLELLGSGGMGIVYKGRQPLLDRLVAIKVIRPDMSADDSAQDRFLREGRALAKLRHPFIATVFDIQKTEDLYCLVMEYVEGSSLRQLLQAGNGSGSITERRALDYVPQMTEALQHAHEAGVVHRDIKPENILVDARGRIRLVDFGLATLFGPSAPARAADDDRVAGTLQYMAPEQMTMPGSVDHRADIYATGIVFYEMLAHEVPGPERVPPSRKAATDPRLDPIVLRAIEKDRDRRYQEARLLERDLIGLARTPETTIRIEQYIATPPEQVFTAWIEPQQIRDWYAPSDDFGPTLGQVDPQVGGDYRIGMMLPGATEPRFVSGQYCKLDAPRTLSFTWAWEPLKPGWNETQVTLDFQPRGEGTNLVLTHERFRSEPDKADHTQGWRGCLGRLSRKLGG
jgi:serine/threonine protein kinase